MRDGAPRDATKTLYKDILNSCTGAGHLPPWTGDECLARVKKMNAQVGPHNLYNMVRTASGDVADARACVRVGRWMEGGGGHGHWAARED